VPVVAFDLGAPAERIPALGGRVVPVGAGVDGLVAAVDEMARFPVAPRVPAAAAAALPTPATVAAAWEALHRDLGWRP
jgi:hypothetical protein